MGTIDECAPERSVRKKSIKICQPWVTSDLKRCIKKQHELYKTHLEAPTDDHQNEYLQKIQSLFTKGY